MDSIFDLTHILDNNTPAYPGTQPPEISITGDIEKDGFRELLLHIQSHTGTHLDVPAHIFKQGKNILEFPVDHFNGKGIVIPNSIQNPLNRQLTEDFKEQLSAADFVLFYTGWDKFWGTNEYFSGYPIPEPEVLEYLCTFNLKGIGLDTISLDPVTDEMLPNHRLVLSKNIIIIENLTNLSGLLNRFFEFSCYPLAIKNGDGSPVRAVAKLIDS